MLMASELGARAGLWSNLAAVLFGVLGVILGFAGLVKVIRAKQAEATAATAAQAAAQTAAAAQQRQEVESILGKYTGPDDEPGRRATYLDNLTDGEISQAREMDMDLHGRVMG